MWREIIVGSSPTWGTMKKLIIRHKGFIVKAHVSEKCTVIIDSHRIKSPCDMESIIYYIKAGTTDEYAINKMGISSMIHKWRTYNLLYSLGIKGDKINNVDLTTSQPWYIKALYFILSPFYLHFE